MSVNADQADDFDKGYWEDHWTRTAADEGRGLPVHPYLRPETASLPVGSALDAGCGIGTEALWLARHGWQVTGADISGTALAIARARTQDAGLSDRIEWIETDLTRWEPDRRWDLVVTSYAHADIGQLAFYRRIASWVAPGGTLLIVGHVHDHATGADGHRHPDGATATLGDITGLFRDQGWRVGSAYENSRAVSANGRSVQLFDVILRLHRTAP